MIYFISAIFEMTIEDLTKQKNHFVQKLYKKSRTKAFQQRKEIYLFIII